ncbi:MAG: thrombospondin type 3 repeat-containing protein, partial [Kofleriaceae bacterium]|nr:thrombospondin type 3 repeat-containing protein [Kofleriaceae bacterium]
MWNRDAIRGVAILGFALAMPAAARAQTVRIVPLAARDLGYDASRDTLWATVDPVSTTFGSQIVPIDPVTGVVSQGVAMGLQPYALDVADDGRYAYVGHLDSPEIRRVALASRSVDLIFALAPQVQGPVFAQEIEVAPTDAHSVAIVSAYSGISPQSTGIALYDDGVERGTSVDPGANRLEFAQDGSVLFGLVNEVSSFAAVQMSVGPSGLAVLDSLPDRVVGFYRDFHAADDMLVGTDGSVIQQADLRLAGHVAAQPSANAVVSDPATRGLYFVSRGGVEVFDRHRFVPRAWLPISGLLGSPADAVLLGPGRLAFRTTDRQVVIVDLEVGAADQDGDGVLDAFDACVAAPNPDQADRDADGAGDACDAHPNDPRNGFLACDAELGAASAALPALVDAIAQCSARGFPDADGDGEPDASDRCAATPSGLGVDAVG